MLETLDHRPTVTVEQVLRDMLNYFAAVGAAPGRTFGIRDFDSQVMMNAYAPRERECLGLALASLCEAGILRRVSDTDYVLTATGVSRARALRRSKDKLPQ